MVRDGTRPRQVVYFGHGPANVGWRWQPSWFLLRCLPEPPRHPRAGAPSRFPISSRIRTPASPAYAFNYGNARIRAHLNWSDGVLRAGRLPGGGSVSPSSIPTDRSTRSSAGGAASRDASRSPVGDGENRQGRASASRVAPCCPSYPTIGFIPSGLTFPTTGCWRVEPHVQGVGRLTFVVLVTKRVSDRG